MQKYIELCPSFQIFLASINSDRTKVTYRKGINHFMNFHGIKDYQDIVKADTDTIQDWLEKWIIGQKDKGLRHNTIVGRLNSVELFLDMNKKTWFRKIVRKLLPSNDEIPGGEVPFTTDEIYRMLQACKKPRDAAILHFFASTAARPASIEDPVLRKKHLLKIEDCYGVKIYDGSKEGYWAFLTPEARKALDIYFNSRKRNGEDITDESPLFATYPNEPKTQHEWMSLFSARRTLDRFFKVAGIERKKIGNRFDKAIVYGFRKRFNGILKMDNQINSNITEKLMAHKNGLDGHYLKPTMEECFREFKKAIPELTIDPTKRLKMENEKLESKNKDKQMLEDKVARQDQAIVKILSDLDELKKIQ